MTTKTLLSVTPNNQKPIAHKKLKAHGIYAIKHVIPAEDAARWNAKQEQRGIVILDGMKNIIATWNFSLHTEWKYAGVSADELQTITFCNAYTLERQFANLFLQHEAEVYTLGKQLEAENNRRLEQEVIYESRLAHPLHKFSDWLIKIFG